MGDGRSFDQAVRQLDKFIAETAARSEVSELQPDPVRRAYERIISGAASLQPH
jgi:hypothetical protein